MEGETISMIKLKKIFLVRLQDTPYETISRLLGLEYLGRANLVHVRTEQKAVLGNP